MSKFEISCLGSESTEGIVEPLYHELPAAREMRVVRASCYLGVMVGPKAELTQWDGLVVRFVPRAVEVTRSGRI